MYRKYIEAVFFRLHPSSIGSPSWWLQWRYILRILPLWKSYHFLQRFCIHGSVWFPAIRIVIILFYNFHKVYLSGVQARHIIIETKICFNKGIDAAVTCFTDDLYLFISSTWIRHLNHPTHIQLRYIFKKSIKVFHIHPFSLKLHA